MLIQCDIWFCLSSSILLNPILNFWKGFVANIKPENSPDSEDNNLLEWIIFFVLNII